MTDIAITRPETAAERELSRRLNEPAATGREKYLVDAIVSLRERLAAAEDALVMHSWSGVDDGQRAKAAHELWLYWCRVSGFRSDPEEFPHLTDELIEQLAARRDETRRLTLAKLFRGQS